MRGLLILLFGKTKAYGKNLRKIGRLVFKQLLLTGFVSVKSVQTKDLLSGSRTSKASHHFSSYRVIEQALKLLSFHMLGECYGKLQDKFQFATVLLW